jgi:flagellar L-ring protein precursor FlgH
MKRLLIVLIGLGSLISIQAQDMRKNATFSLFSDNKAGQIGDAITIVVLESTHASNNAATSTARKSDLSLGLSANTGKTNGSTNIDGGLKTGNDFSGEGSTQTSGTISTKISATVDSILANGNLVISGNKKISINGEDQIVHIKGIVRTTDIQPDNSVVSYNISNAEISFEGNGIIENAQEPGFITKFLHWLF